jgi:hypothetical protein
MSYTKRASKYPGLSADISTFSTICAYAAVGGARTIPWSFWAGVGSFQKLSGRQIRDHFCFPGLALVQVRYSAVSRLGIIFHRIPLTVTLYYTVESHKYIHCRFGFFDFFGFVRIFCTVHLHFSMYSVELGGFDVVKCMHITCGGEGSYCSELPVKEESGQYSNTTYAHIIP